MMNEVEATLSLGAELNCVFRKNVRQEGGRETATCLLLQQITGAGREACTVDRTACEACSTCSLSPAARLNPVIPSLLFHVCQSALAGNVLGTRQAQLQRLLIWAAQNIERPEAERRVTYSCDVVICCGESDEHCVRAVQSVLKQQDVVSIVHLIDDGGGGAAIIAHFEHHPQVIVHRNDTPRGCYATLHDLVPRLQTPFVAIQDPATVSRPDRLKATISLMEESQGEIAGSALRLGDDVIEAMIPDGTWRACLAPETLVFRRASLVDMGGFSNRKEGVAAEIVHRAAYEGRRVLASPLPLVVHVGSRKVETAGAAPVYDSAEQNQQGRGFPKTAVACDVVLPFHSQPEFVHEAIESVVSQENAGIVVHLIDDAGHCGDAVFARWRSHPAVRTYRNATNIGPFASFNNAIEFVETDLVAVQDADDISLPHRLFLAGNHLRLSDSDIFGGRSKTFGENTTVQPDNRAGAKRKRIQRSPFRWSRFPRTGVRYFLENPTAVMRVAAFRQLGGYADFGERNRNRTGVDTEFFARAYYSGLRFAITREVVLNYRCHANSATQNDRSGWGTKSRSEAFAERNRRIDIFQREQFFDPRSFGALTRRRGVTRRV